MCQEKKCVYGKKSVSMEMSMEMSMEKCVYGNIYGKKHDQFGSQHMSCFQPWDESSSLPPRVLCQHII